MSIGDSKMVDFKVGGFGPAGGVVIYDKGFLSSGWRFIEVSRNDLRLVKGIPSIDKQSADYANSESRFIFGDYYDSNMRKPLPKRGPLFVNGKRSYNKKNCTVSEIGSGFLNTELLVQSMGINAHCANPSEITGFYAARLCSLLEFSGFSDWFLPSSDELDLLYSEQSNVLNGFANGFYWSSSEDPVNAGFAKGRFFGKGYQNGLRCNWGYVRPIRYF